MCDYIGFCFLKCRNFTLNVASINIIVRLMDGGRLVETPML